MAKAKKRSDGRYQKSFKYQGQRIFVYGRTKKELADNEAKKRKKLEAEEIAKVERLRAEEAARMAEIERLVQERENPTLNSYYEYFTEVRSKTVKESTIRAQSFQYRAASSVVLADGKTLGECRIKDITARDMQTVQIALASTPRTTETVNNIMNHMKHVFNAAIRDDTIEKNPCKCIVNLRRTEKPAGETIHRALTEDETTAFLKAAKERNSFYYNLLAFMLNSGMRVGEASALTIDDIDTKAGVIHVTKTVTREKGGAYVLGETPKTDAGRRDIKLSPELAKLLNEQRKQNYRFFGLQELKTIFTNTEGGILRDYCVDREMERCCKVAEIERITSHALRDTFATRFIEQYPDRIKELSKILGHSDIGITFKKYIHPTEEREREAMNNFSIKLA